MLLLASTSQLEVEALAAGVDVDLAAPGVVAGLNPGLDLAVDRRDHSKAAARLDHVDLELVRRRG